MHRAVIIAKGEVQGVGYRSIVRKIAIKLNIVGRVRNIKLYDVEIIAEGEKKNLDEFIEKIKIKEFPVSVEGLDTKWEESTGEYDTFEIERGNLEEELGERLDIARDVMNKMLDKQDELKTETHSFREETNQNFTTLRDDYGRISKELTRAIEGIERMAISIEKLTKAVVALVEKSGKQVGTFQVQPSY